MTNSKIKSAQVANEIEAIRDLARRFRRAIEQCDRKYLPIAFAEFPVGSCGDASLLLAKFLQQNGYAGFSYISRMRNDRSHAWLQKNDLVVDITADQFDDQSMPVIVEMASAWHETFRRNGTRDDHHADFEAYDSHTAATLGNAYRAIQRVM